MSPTSRSCEIDVRVSPRASRNAVLCESGRIKVKVTAAPTDGQANEAVVEAVARALAVPKSRVGIVKGHTSREKRLLIDGLDLAEAMNRIGGESLF